MVVTSKANDCTMTPDQLREKLKLVAQNRDQARFALCQKVVANKELTLRLNKAKDNGPQIPYCMAAVL